MSRERSNATRPQMLTDMPNVNTSATLWPAIRHQADGITKELIRDHTAAVAEFARTYGLRIPLERRLELWLSFSATFPILAVDHEGFMDAFRDVHGLWPNGRRLIRRAR